MSPTVATPPVTTTAGVDPRVAAYCSPDGPEVFSGIVHGNQIWTPDPFDVPVVHSQAREAFGRLLDRASETKPPPHGKSLLLLGEAGSGKTHLMRAFRNVAHEDGTGYCGYMQMLSRSDNYPRYVLSYLIDSLEQPYRANDSVTGLGRLARGLFDAVAFDDPDRDKLCEDLLEPEEVARIVFRFADIAVQDVRFARIDINLLRAVLFLLPNDGRIRPKVLNWLRCEELPRFDRDALGGLVPRPGPEMPLKTIVDLGRLIHAVHSAALVLLVDQMDEMIELAKNDAQPGEQFRAAANTLIDITDSLPNAVVVIGCLEDLYRGSGRAALPLPKLDRLEQDPTPIRLEGPRAIDEVRAIAARRLGVLFGTTGLAVDATNPLAPYSEADVAPLAGLRTRDVLNFFREHRERCVAAGAWVSSGVAPPPVPPPPPPVSDFAKLWNDFFPTVHGPLVGEGELAELLSWSISAASDEVSHGLVFSTDTDDRFVPVEVQSGNAVDRLLVAVCDKTSKGGHLGKQLDETVKRAGTDIPVVFVRSTEFPKAPGTGVASQLAKLCVPVGRHRKHHVANSDWRAMIAFRTFAQEHGKKPGFREWRRSDRPLAELPAIRKILDLDRLESAAPKSLPPSPPLPPAGKAKETVSVTVPSPAAPKLARPVAFASTRGAVPVPVALEAKSLCRHAAFLGGPGSGKTTAVLAVIEELLLAGVPAVLIDRKGDLARYADPAAWESHEPDAGRAARRARLRGAIDVALYTPGTAGGRPLAIPVVPPDLAAASQSDREQLAQYAAAGFGVMMGYKARGLDPKLVILQKAIETLAASGAAVTVNALQKLIGEQDDMLLAQFDGQYEGKHFKSLGQDLYTLGVRHRRLLEGDEVLDVGSILGRGPGAVPGKTRLTVINTQALGDANTTDFWVSQLLIAVERWRVKTPAPEGALQAVFLLDEADVYLPANGKPATKAPLESLLKRARSAGIGLFLATQSPGDLDYKCRDQVLTWLLGRVKEKVALDKLRPMLEAKPGSLERLSQQKAGEFYLVRESDVQPVQVTRNLIPTEQLPEDRILELARNRYR